MQKFRNSILDKIRQYWRFDDTQIHTHSWHDREDFIRDHLEPYVKDVAALESDQIAELARLREIVDRLDKSKDGEPVLEGDTLWMLTREGLVSGKVRRNGTKGLCCFGHGKSFHYIIPVAECYSSESTARTVQGN